MYNLLPLIQNETLKIWKKKRFFVIVLILLVLIPIFTYAELKVTQNNAEKFKDWHNQVLQQMTDMQNTLSSDRIPEEWKRTRRVMIQQLQYYLDHNVNPAAPNAVNFTREFMDNSVNLFIPLLVLALGSDLISGERTTGTIKMLLTKPVKRWKVLFSKLVALALYVSLTIAVMELLCYAVSGLFFGYGGWTMPVFTGFEISNTNINSSNVHAVPQWLYLFMQAGLVWVSAMTIALLAIMVSVLMRSTAASMVTMMAAVITGTILTNMSSSWQSAKYLFAVNLKLTGYLDGTPPPIEGMSFLFSLVVLAVWAIVSLVISFGVFTKQDILN